MPQKKEIRDKRLSIAKNMPPLPRKQVGQEYNVANDRVLDWVKTHSDLGLYLVDLLARIGYIKYDSATGTWYGIDYED